jgi:predicted metal-dependent peptidase
MFKRIFNWLFKKEEEIREIRELSKEKKVKILIIQNFYFLSHLLQVVKIELFKQKNPYQIAYTDGVKVYIAKEVWAKESPKNLAFIVTHELFHIILKHLERFKRLDKKHAIIWNIATDLLINETLLQKYTSFDSIYEDKMITFENLEKRGILNEDEVSKLKKKKAEDIYYYLLRKMKNNELNLSINENSKKGETVKISGGSIRNVFTELEDFDMEPFEFSPDMKKDENKQKNKQKSKLRDDEKEGEGEEVEEGKENKQKKEGKIGKEGESKEVEEGKEKKIEKEIEGKGIKELKEREKLEKEIKSAINKAIQSLKLKGDIEGSLELLLDNFYKPKVNWKKVLRKYLNDKIRKVISYSRIHKKKSSLFHYKVIYPGYKEIIEKGKLKATIVIDTSGSISDSDLKQFVSEVFWILKEHEAEIRVIQHDVVIQKIDYLNNIEDLKQFEARGRGGTSHKEVIQYLLENAEKEDKKRHLVIFLSDFVSDLTEADIDLVKKRYLDVLLFNEELEMIKPEDLSQLIEDIS